MKLPKDWEIHSLRDFIEKLESGVSVNAEDIPVSDGSPAVLKVGCVSGGVFYPQENKRILESEIHRAKLTVRKGTVIISRSNTQELVGESAYIKQDYPNLYLSDKTWQTIFKQDAQVDARWLGHLLSSPSVKMKLGNLSNGTSGSMKNISKESFLSLEVITPPPEEQSAIADFLDVLDHNIEQTEELIADKTRIKRGLMRQLLTGQKRFKEFDGQEWSSKELKDVGKIESGGTPDTSLPENWNGSINWCTPTDITSLQTRYLGPTVRKLHILTDREHENY
jgi:type I restriction enzyme S subunit